MCRATRSSHNLKPSQKPNVGAGLPAIAVFHSTETLDQMTLSRASSLPQDLWCGANCSHNLNPLVGASLLAKKPERTHQSFGLSTNRRANALACAATSVTAVLSHHIPRNGGPMANNRALTCPSASTTAPSFAVIPSASGPGCTSPRASNCCGNGRATRRQSYSMPLELISVAPLTTPVSVSPRGRMLMVTASPAPGSILLNDAA